MADVCLKAAIRSARLEIAVATTTELCKNAQAAHRLATTSIIALGRLLTAATLIALTSKRRGSTSLQILTKSRLRELFADVSHEGHVRGFVKNAELSFPLMSGEVKSGRRTISLGLLPGKLSVVRAADTHQYTQSTTDLVSGEVDVDVEHFIEKSDQIPNALACDVLVGEMDAVALAGGVLVQGLPGADLERIQSIRSALRNDGLADRLHASKGDANALLASIARDAVVVEAPAPILWKCRCSRARVVEAIRMMSPTDLADMISKNEDVKVACDLCANTYVIPAAEVALIFTSSIKAQG
jgi:molecular chaperone Hsp33